MRGHAFDLMGTNNVEATVLTREHYLEIGNISVCSLCFNALLWISESLSKPQSADESSGLARRKNRTRTKPCFHVTFTCIPAIYDPTLREIGM